MHVIQFPLFGCAFSWNERNFLPIVSLHRESKMCVMYGDGYRRPRLLENLPPLPASALLQKFCAIKSFSGFRLHSNRRNRYHPTLCTIYTVHSCCFGWEFLITVVTNSCRKISCSLFVYSSLFELVVMLILVSCLLETPENRPITCYSSRTTSFSDCLGLHNTFHYAEQSSD